MGKFLKMSMNTKDYLFEISWEVCNKVGGIYTVITSKLDYVNKNFKNYYTIGPYKNDNSDFIPSKIPLEFQDEIQEIEDLGIKIYFGTWNFDKKTKVILIDHKGFSKNINEIKKLLWEHFKIDSLNSKWYDFDDAILWSWTCGLVIEKLTKKNDEKVLIHSHEWMSGGAIFYHKIFTNSNKFKTIFTTHATMLSRAISGSGIDLNEILKKKDVNYVSLAYEKGVHTKHLCEKALANCSNAFTTVSDITNEEAKKFYQKTADIILYNGFDSNLEYNYQRNRKIVENFTQSYFNNLYPVDLNTCQFLYTSGRNEFRNKGVDILIESLSELNYKLKKENSDKTIICFFLIPVGEFTNDPIIEKSFNDSKNNIIDTSTKSYFPLSTNLVPIENEIISSFIKLNLLNKKEDNVKVILVPEYLDDENNLFGLKYYEIISGMDLSIFPSEYEPWGYTPVESIYFSVPTITTNNAGFGKYYHENFNNSSGVSIVDRKNSKSYREEIHSLTEFINKFIFLSIEDKLKLKENSKNVSKEFSWEKFYNNYLDVYTKLLEE